MFRSALVAIGLVAVAVSLRYHVVAIERVYVVDVWAGAVRVCDATGCGPWLR